MTSRKRYAILTPFDKPDIVAGIATIHGIDADIVHTSSGVVLVRDIPVPVFDDWDIAELLGNTPDTDANTLGAVDLSAVESATGSDPSNTASDTASEADQAEQSEAEGEIDSDNALAVAAVFSRLSPYGVVLFQGDLGDDVGGEDGVSGLVKAQRVLAGQAGEELPAGLLLNTLSAQIEQIVVGLVPLDEVSDSVIRAQDAERLLKNMFASQSQNVEKEERREENAEDTLGGEAQGGSVAESGSVSDRRNSDSEQGDPQ